MFLSEENCMFLMAVLTAETAEEAAMLFPGRYRKNTLVDFRHIHKYVAKDGQEGGKRRCHGADADDLIVKVPEGTVIKDFESGKVIADSVR